MIYYSGTNVGNTEFEVIQKEISKLYKFFGFEPDISLRFKEINDDSVELSLKTNYCGRQIYVSVLGNNKISASKKAVDDAVRKIRKIKTDVYNKQDKTTLPINSKEWKAKEKEKVPYLTEKAEIYNVDFFGATEIMEGEGLEIIIFNDDSKLHVLTKTEDGYKVYIIE